ncbi:hypothetical protein F0562_023166 [Nyssa sinensis]|uniref:Major facilitator superfamily (MFS) profile domain-containing protein n=1 Tax=Nyssa sinensis TaxID=561372 RepID=A0A5J5BH85_9ASTE|nr:hypothetical protein F0562_023166 [Nyssa sinensis]
MAGSAGVAIADVTIDACITENSISHPSLAGDMQSLCGMSSSIGALMGFSIGGSLVHHYGPKGVFGVLCVPAGLVILVGMMLREPLVRSSAYRRVNEKFVDAGKCERRPIFLAGGCWVHIILLAHVGSLFGVLLYQNVFRNHPFRQVLFWSQLLYGASGMLDLILVLRINLRLGVPDYLFAVIDDAVSHMIGRLKWMPLLVLSSKLCPSGIEGTFFALLMSIDHVGLLSSSWAGGLILHILNVTRTQFDNLWIAILIRSLLRILPIALLFLVPKSDPNTSILPSEMLRTKKGDDILESENMEMASLVNST